jgi:Skp family chaperone for outer membrane proteins
MGMRTDRRCSTRRQRLQNAIFKKALQVIARIAKEKGLSSVHLIDENRDSYIDPSLVITDEIVKAYNASYPAMTQPPKK